MDNNKNFAIRNIANRYAYRICTGQKLTSVLSLGRSGNFAVGEPNTEFAGSCCILRTAEYKPRLPVVNDRIPSIKNFLRVCTFNGTSQQGEPVLCIGQARLHCVQQIFFRIVKAHQKRLLNAAEFHLKRFRCKPFNRKPYSFHCAADTVQHIGLYLSNGIGDFV